MNDWKKFYITCGICLVVFPLLFVAAYQVGQIRAAQPGDLTRVTFAITEQQVDTQQGGRACLVLIASNGGAGLWCEPAAVPDAQGSTGGASVASRGRPQPICIPGRPCKGWQKPPACLPRPGGCLPR